MRYILNGLDCPSCAAKIEAELRKVKGLEKASVNFATKSVELPSDMVGQAEKIIARVEPEVRLEKIGNNQDSQATEEREERNKLWLIVGAGVLFLVGLIFNEQFTIPGFLGGVRNLTASLFPGRMAGDH